MNKYRIGQIERISLSEELMNVVAYRDSLSHDDLLIHFYPDAHDCCNSIVYGLSPFLIVTILRHCLIFESTRHIRSKETFKQEIDSQELLDLLRPAFSIDEC